MDIALLLWAGAGSALGGMSRFALTRAIQSRLATPFPVATFLINASGSLLLGFLMQIAMESTALGAEAAVFLTTGFCGGYTTFSTFSYETVRLLQDGDYRRAAIYAAASVVLALTAVFIGMALARALLAARRGAL